MVVLTRTLRIANATVAKSDIVNFNVPSRATAQFVRVGLHYELPPADAIAVLTAAALESQGVLHSPAPVIYLEEFADSSIVYAIKFWIEDAGQHEIIQHRVRVHLWYRLRARLLDSLPHPHRRTLQPRPEKPPPAGHRTHAPHRSHRGRPAPPAAFSGAETPLADSANELYLMTGQVLFRQGDSGDSFYIIFKGSVEVLVTPEGGTEERRVATLGPGDFFGEMSALTGQPRTPPPSARQPRWPACRSKSRTCCPSSRPTCPSWKRFRRSWPGEMPSTTPSCRAPAKPRRPKW